MKKFKIMLMTTIVLATMVVGLSVSTIVLAIQNSALMKKDQTEPVTCDFYLTMGTMPTLYATLNAYANQNPNTYMWFTRGNTISKEYSADYIHYFDTLQATDNSDSQVDFLLIREKVRDILALNPNVKFRLWCDDLRVQFIPDIFVAAGVDFADLEVTLLSDGTGTYNVFSNITEPKYTGQAAQWQQILQDYTDHRADHTYTKYTDTVAGNLQDLAFYVSTFDNVQYWIQNPEYLVNTLSPSFNQAREQMNIVKKSPEVMYQGLDAATRAEYQKVVLANALVGSDTLHSLDDAVNYFNEQLSGRDKELVLILGTKYDDLTSNQTYVDQTLAYYTPTVKADDATKAVYKGHEYAVVDNKIKVGDKTLPVGECAVYLFFKGHPAYPANAELSAYFAEKGIVVLPHRTPVEVLFWMYDVKVGGFQSTSFLSTTAGQTEFFYEAPTQSALLLMKEAGFFDNAVIFTK